MAITVKSYTAVAENIPGQGKKALSERYRKREKKDAMETYEGLN